MGKKYSDEISVSTEEYTAEASDDVEWCAICEDGGTYSVNYRYRFYEAVICEDCIDFIKCILID
jgi:hypothetical protein